jgi:hypothetical protein
VPRSAADAFLSKPADTSRHVPNRVAQESDFMRNRRIPAWLALLLAAVLLSPPSLPALEATQNFELNDGESITLQAFSITATGGFHGYKRGADQTTDILEFVRDGSSSVQVIVQRSPGLNGVGAVSFGAGWSRPNHCKGKHSACAGRAKCSGAPTSCPLCRGCATNVLASLAPSRSHVMEISERTACGPYL